MLRLALALMVVKAVVEVMVLALARAWPGSDAGNSGSRGRGSKAAATAARGLGNVMLMQADTVGMRKEERKRRHGADSAGHAAPSYSPMGLSWLCCWVWPDWGLAVLLVLWQAEVNWKKGGGNAMPWRERHARAGALRHAGPVEKSMLEGGDLWCWRWAYGGA